MDGAIRARRGRVEDGGSGRCQGGFVLRKAVVLAINFARPPGIVSPIPRRSSSVRRCRLRAIDQQAMEMVANQRINDDEGGGGE